MTDTVVSRADADSRPIVVAAIRNALATAALPFLDNVTRERYIKETGHNPWAKKPGGGD